MYKIETVKKKKNVPNDASPEKRKDHVEKQRAPYYKVVDPRPVVCVKSELQRTYTQDGTIQLVQLYKKFFIEG